MRILVVDDNALVRRGVIDILASRKSWEVCAEAQDGAEALQKARDSRPDVILLDISMPGMNGLEVARAVRQELNDAKILILSQHDAASLLPSAIQAGANGCVDKSRLGTDLLSSIEAVAGTAQVRGIADSD
ncbi:MAG: response regulator transcription factor [Candidatus Sulfotelmatobacter sp.]